MTSSDCPADGRTWVPFQDKCYYFVHGAEDQIKSYTYERARSLCLGFGNSDKETESQVVFSAPYTPSLLSCILFFLELLSIQSAEENDFAMNYSPAVWKGTVNVWLGMYFDTNSEYHVTGGRK